MSQTAVRPIYSFSGTSASSDGQCLTISTSVGTDLAYRMDNATYWNADSNGTTVEVRLKIDSQDTDWTQMNTKNFDPRMDANCHE